MEYPQSKEERPLEDRATSRIARAEPWILFVTALLPTLVTLAYFVVLAGGPAILQKGVFGFGKIVQFLIPVVWVGLVCRQPWKLRSFTTRGLGEGVGFGLLVFAAMMLLYFVFLQYGPLGPQSRAVEGIRDRIGAFGIENPVLYVLFGLFYFAVHSGLEEYYWRWFVFGQLNRRLGFVAALLLSSLGFMAHHVVILGTYFGFAHWMTWFGSFAVSVGGAYWCWSYRRFDTIWAAWISHGLVDAAIFSIGFHIVFRT